LAQVFDLQENTYNKHVHLVPMASLASGPGSISGYLTFEGNEPSSIQEANVILSDQDNHPLHYSQADPSGSFTFSNLPLGVYIIRADLTGRPSEPFSVILTSSAPNSGSVELVVDEQAYYEVEEIPQNAQVSAKIYPNPANDHINVELMIDRDQPVNIQINDMMGRTLQEKHALLQKGRITCTLNIEQFPRGAYLVRIELAGSTATVIRKFVK
jgi:hypothetical protein